MTKSSGPSLRTSLILLGAVAALLAARGEARAQGYAADWGFNGAPQAAMMASSYQLQLATLSSAMSPRRGGSGGGGKVSAKRISTVTRGRSTAARTMAASFPERSRAHAQASYEGLLNAYGAVETQLEIPHGDIAGAMALFVLTSYEAIRDTQVDPSLYPVVIDQLRDALATNPELARMTEPRRREVFEAMAITGMFVGAVKGGLAARPDAELERKVKQGARDYLAQMKIDPDRLRVGKRGLEMTGG